MAKKKATSVQETSKKAVKRETAVPQKETEKRFAIIGIILNTLVMPGTGTLVAGETRTGLIQLILALISIPLMLVAIGFLLFGGVWIWALVTSIQHIQKTS